MKRLAYFSFCLSLLTITLWTDSALAAKHVATISVGTQSPSALCPTSATGATYSVSVTSDGGSGSLNGVVFSATGLPSGAIALFNPAALSWSNSETNTTKTTTLTITTSATPTGTTSFTVQNTDNGVTGSGSLTVANPGATASNNGPTCAGETLQLTGGPSGFTYLWSGPNSFTSTQQSPSISNVTTAASGTYTLIVTNVTGGGCTSSANTSATVDSTASNSLSVTPSSTTICSGSTVAVTVGSSQTGITYQLFNGASASGSSTAGTGSNLVLTSAALTASTTLTVKATQHNCTPVTLTNSVAVTVNASPNTGLTVTPATTSICPSSTVAVTVQSSETDVSYQLYNNSNPSGSAANGNGGNLVLTSAALTANATLTVKATRSPCSTVELSSSVAVTVVPFVITDEADNLTRACGESASFSVTASGLGSLSYQWYKGTSPTGTTISGATSSTYNIASVAMTDAGSYYVNVTDASCGSTISAATLTITSCPCSATCAAGYECRDEVCTLMASVSGQVTQSSVGLAGVKITVTDARTGGVESMSTVTDPAGYYTAEYPAAWTSIAKDAQRFGFTFSASGNNFTATAVTLPPRPTCSGFGTTVSSFTGEAIQEAINEAADATTIFLPAGTYVIDEPIVMRRTVTVGCSGGNCITCDKGECETGSTCTSFWDCADATHHAEMRDGVRLVGQGAGTILQPSSSFPSDAPVIDATQLFSLSISHLRIGGGAAGTGVQAGTPRVGLLAARVIPGASSGIHHLENLQIEGAFSLACVLNLGSEVNDWKDCIFSNTSGGPAFYTTGYDNGGVVDDPPYDVKSHFGIYTDSEAWYSYLEFAGNGWNNTVHYYTGCYFGASNLGSEGCALRMQGSNQVTFHSCGFAVKKAVGTTLARAAVKIDRVDFEYNTPPFTELTFQGCHAAVPDAKNFLYLITPTGQESSPTGVIGGVFLNNNLVSSESVVYGGASTGGDDWHISGGRMKCLGSGLPLMSLYDMSNSYFRDVSWTASSAVETRNSGTRNTFCVRRLQDVSPVNTPHTRIMTSPPEDDRVEYRGYVRDSNGAGISGVTIMASGVGGPFITDWNGEFVARAPSTWASEFTPMALRHGCSFSPTSIEAGEVPVPDPCVFVISFDRDNEFDSASYACVTAGSASSLQTAITNAEAGDTIYVPAGPYFLTNPLDFSDKTNVAIIGEGLNTNIYASDWCTSNWDDDSLVNMSGSVGCSIQRISLASHGGVLCDGDDPVTNECINETNHDTLHHHASMPQTALLLAGGGSHYFQALGTSFWWRTASLLSYKSEDNVFDSCAFDTLQPEAHSAIISSSDDFGINGTEGVTGESQRHLLRSCYLNTNGGGTGGCGYDPAGTDTEVNLLIQDAHDVSAYSGSWGNSTRSGGLLTASNKGGLASIKLDGTAVSGITVAGTRFETQGAKNVILVTADASGVALHNNMMESAQSVIAANSGEDCENWIISAGVFEAVNGESWGSDLPMVSFDTLTDSTLYLNGGYKYSNLAPPATGYVPDYMLKITSSDDNLLHVHELDDMDHPGGSDSVIIADDCCVTVTAWRSVRTHTTVGALAITLNATATGNGTSGPTSESRNNGIQRIEVDFSQAVTLVGGGAALTVSGVSHISGTPQSPVSYTPTSISLADSDTLAITFDNGVLPNETCYTINVSGAVLGTGGQNLIGDTDCKVRAVVANVNSDGVVTLSDVLAVNANIGDPVTGTDIKYDIDLDNDIDNDDKAVVTSQSGKQAFCP